jgi:hypothetical protein
MSDVRQTHLSPDDLRNFLMRRQAVEQAAIASAMMQAGFKAWAEEIRARYEIPGLFDVDIVTGEIRDRG